MGSYNGSGASSFTVASFSVTAGGGAYEGRELGEETGVIWHRTIKYLTTSKCPESTFSLAHLLLWQLRPLWDGVLSFPNVNMAAIILLESAGWGTEACVSAIQLCSPAQFLGSVFDGST